MDAAAEPGGRAGTVRGVHPHAALAVRGGSARWTDLADDVARGSLLAAVAAGTVLRPARGVFALPGADAAQVAALAVGGRTSCLSAAQARGWDVLRPPGRIHVTAPAGGRREWRGAVVHRAGPAQDVGGWTGVDETVLAVARCAPLVEAVVVLDGLVRGGLRSPDELLALTAGLRAGDPRRRAVALVDPAAQSVLESAVRVGCVLRGLRVESQVQLPGVGRVDLLVEGWLVVETDGRATHLQTFAQDRRRDSGTALLGGLTLRFGWHDVVERLERTLDTVEAVALAGPRGRGLTATLGS